MLILSLILFSMVLNATLYYERQFNKVTLQSLRVVYEYICKIFNSKMFEYLSKTNYTNHQKSSSPCCLPRQAKVNKRASGVL